MTQNIGGLGGTLTHWKSEFTFVVLVKDMESSRDKGIEYESETAKSWVMAQVRKDNIGEEFPALSVFGFASWLINYLLSLRPAPAMCSMTWGLPVFASPGPVCLATSQVRSIGFLPGAMGRLR